MSIRCILVTCLAVCLSLSAFAQAIVLYNVGDDHYFTKRQPRNYPPGQITGYLNQTEIVKLTPKEDSTVTGEIMQTSVAKTATLSSSGTTFSIGRLLPGDSGKLNQSIAQKGKLEYLYIYTFDISLLAHNTWSPKKDTLFVNDTLILSHCIIANMVFPNQAPKDSSGKTPCRIIVFNEPFMMNYCSLPASAIKNICFKKDFVLICNNLTYNDYASNSDNVIGPQFIMDSCCFKGNTYLYNNVGLESSVYDKNDRFSLSESTRSLGGIYAAYYRHLFQDADSTVRMQVLSIRKDSRFEGNVYINNSSPYKIADLESDKFIRNLYIQNFWRDDIPLYAATISRQFKHVDAQQDQLRLSNIVLWTNYNCNFQNDDFAGKVAFINTSCVNFNFYRALFHSVVAVNSSKFDSANIFNSTSHAFNKALFHGCSMLNTEDGPDLDNMKISSQSYAELRFKTPAMMQDDEASHVVSENFFNILKLSVSQQFKDDKVNREAILAKIDHDETVYEIGFDKRNAHLFNGHWWTYMYRSGLEHVVGNGYQGASRFLAWVLWLTVLFIILYLLFFRNTISAIMGNDPGGNGAQNNLVAIILYSCWFSVVTLISPKLQLRYLKYSISFSVVVLLEWAIGVVLIILFLYFIAPTYPVIKALFSF